MVISNSDVTIQNGLKERRLFHLKKTVERKELVGLIVLQITDLVEFLGLEKKMNAKQIFDAAEFILDDWDNFSLMGLQHCFNLIKKSEPPFDDKLYNTISGKKIIEWLRRYDQFIDDYLFSDANRKIEYDKYRSSDRQPTAGDKLINVAGAFRNLKQVVKDRGLSEAAKQYKNDTSK